MSLEKLKKNQGVKLVEITSLFLVFALILAGLFFMGNKYLEAQKHKEASRNAEALAMQLISGGLGQGASFRGPASVKGFGASEESLRGKISEDPWGQAFLYKLSQNKEGLKTHVLVWSKGPDGKRNTHEKEILEILNKKTQVFGHDDLGVVKVFDHKNRNFE